ncbi:MAG TPA: Do family serine endopeptidase [Anseongella sp.]
MKRILSTVLIAALGGLIALGMYKIFEKPGQVTSIEEKQQAQFASLNKPAVVGSAGLVDFTQAAAQVTPAVVYIQTTYPMNYRNGGGQQFPFNDFFDFFDAPRGRQQQPRRAPRASGSGVIITADGYIVTNNHVVQDGEKVEVTLNSRETYEAEVIGTDPGSDLALLKINSKDLPFIPYGNSDAVQVGEWVLAVGNPFDLRSTVTAGIVSATARSIGILGSDRPLNSGETPTAAIESFIQTDAVINRGNSGGALVNTKGELVGINTAIISHTGSYEGYGFAVPVNIVKKVIDDLLKYGQVQRAFIGVSFTPIDAAFSKEKELNINRGIYVEDVVEGGAAAEAGIRGGDIITRMDDREIMSTGDLMAVVGRHAPGDKVDVTILREGKERKLKLTFKNRQGSEKPQVAAAGFEKLGIELKPLSDEEKQELRTDNGVRVTDIDENSQIYRYTQIREGFVITRVNGTEVSSQESIERALKNTQQGMVQIQGFFPNQPGMYTYTFPLKAE